MADRDIPGPKKKMILTPSPNSRLRDFLPPPGTLQVKGGACVASSTNPRPPSMDAMLSMLLASFVMVDPSCPYCRSLHHIMP